MLTPIEFDDKRLIDSGMFFLPEKQCNTTLALHLDINPVDKIFLLFVDQVGQDMHADIHPAEDGISIEFVNFGGALGSGTTSPILIGEHDGKKIWMHLWTYTYSENKVRKVEYSIYEEK